MTKRTVKSAVTVMLTTISKRGCCDYRRPGGPKFPVLRDNWLSQF